MRKTGTPTSLSVLHWYNHFERKLARRVHKEGRIPYDAVAHQEQ